MLINLSLVEIFSAIRSLLKSIRTHLEWLSNPMFYQKQVANDFPDFNSRNGKLRKNIVTSTHYKNFTHTHQNVDALKLFPKIQLKLNF